MSESLYWDPLLIQRYNRAGPRYTSYPTALEFVPCTDHNHELEIISNRDTNKPLSLYVHIPFCTHVCYYCGCNKIVTKHKEQAIPYLELLKKEIDAKANALKGNPIVEQMHWGGGTPTFLSDEQITDLFGYIKERFNFSTADSADYSIEIDPRELRPTTLKTLRELGFNRTSFGVQDVHEKVQKAVNRVQPVEMIEGVMKEARELGFRSINIDLIYGLPHQTLETFDETLDVIIGLSPDRLSVFNYAHLPERFKPQRRINEEDLPSAQDKLNILGLSINKLANADYHYVGMDHFAKPDDELSVAQANKKLHRNFQGYTTHGNCDLIGLGVSSISQIGDHYLQNTPVMDTYEHAIAAGELALFKELTLKEEDIIRRTGIMSLLCHLELNYQALSEEFGIDAKAFFAESIERLAPMEQDQLVEITDQAVTITEKGRLLARNICMEFDEYLAQKNGKNFSKAI